MNKTEVLVSDFENAFSRNFQLHRRDPKSGHTFDPTSLVRGSVMLGPEKCLGQFTIRYWILQLRYASLKRSWLRADVGGKRCPDSVRVYCTVSVRQNLKFSVGRVFECPDFEFELDFDRQTPHSKSGQRCPPTSVINYNKIFNSIWKQSFL